MIAMKVEREAWSLSKTGWDDNQLELRRKFRATPN